MDTEKKPAEPKAEQAKHNVGDLVGDLVVSGATNARKHRGQSGCQPRKEGGG